MKEQINKFVEDVKTGMGSVIKNVINGVERVFKLAQPFINEAKDIGKTMVDGGKKIINGLPNNIKDVHNVINRNILKFDLSMEEIKALGANIILEEQDVQDKVITFETKNTHTGENESGKQSIKIENISIFRDIDGKLIADIQYNYPESKDKIIIIGKSK